MTIPWNDMQRIPPVSEKRRIILNDRVLIIEVRHTRDSDELVVRLGVGERPGIWLTMADAAWLAWALNDCTTGRYATWPKPGEVEAQ
jgi:hypothetical protein